MVLVFIGEVIFWLFVVFLVVVSSATMWFGRVNTEKVCKTWADAHGWPVTATVLIVGFVLRSESLILAIFWLAVLSCAAWPWALELLKKTMRMAKGSRPVTKGRDG